VYIKYLLATPPEVVHDASGVATQVENHWSKRRACQAWRRLSANPTRLWGWIRILLNCKQQLMQFYLRKRINKQGQDTLMKLVRRLSSRSKLKVSVYCSLNC